MRKQIMMRGAVLAAAAAFGLGLTACEDDLGRFDPASGTTGPTPPASQEPPGDPGDPGGQTAPGSPGSQGGQDGGGGAPPAEGGDGSGGGPAGPVNEPPYIRDLFQDAYVYGDNEGIEATIAGHAYDPDGPHEQENTARVAIEWGDGTTTDAGLGGHGAFDAPHEYDISYAGRTVTVRVVAHGYDGQTATETIDLDLPPRE